MDINSIAILATGVGVLALAAWVFLSVRASLVALIDQLVRLPAATAFFSRVFMLCLTLGAAEKILESRTELGPDANFMEGVWKVASGVGDGMETLLILLLAFLGMMTVLVAVLAGRRD